MSFNRQTLSVLTSTLGIRGDYTLPVSYGVWAPHVRLEYKHDFQGAGLASLQYADWLTGPTYSTAADPLDQNQILLGLGAELKTRQLTFSVEYKGSVANQDEIVHEITGKLIFPF